MQTTNLLFCEPIAQALTESGGQIKSAAISGERNGVPQAIVNGSAMRAPGQMRTKLFS